MSLRDCIVHDCWSGSGSDAPLLRRAAREPGTIADRCTFLRNKVAVTGAAVATNCIFSGNDCIARPSPHHVVHDASDDHFVFAGNLIGRHALIIDGESVLGPANVFAEPRFSGSLAALEADWPPVPPAIRPASDSPGNGRARDGGDIGALGNPGTAGTLARVWMPTGSVLSPLLALGPLDAAAGESAASLRTAVLRDVPAAGRRTGGPWWAALPAGDDGASPLRPHLGTAARGWIAAFVETASACEAEVEINGDLSAAEVFWNGKPAPGPVLPRRFHSSGATIALKAPPGRNALLLYVTGRSGEARIGIACRTKPAGALKGPVAAAGPAPLSATSARLVREQDGGAFVEISTSAPLNWTDAGRAGLIRFTDPDGDLPAFGALPVVIRAPQNFRVGPLPTDPPEGLAVTLAGFRDPAGRPYPAGQSPSRVTGIK